MGRCFRPCRAQWPHQSPCRSKRPHRSLRPIVHELVASGSTISTDELRSYGLLTKDGYRHGHVNHAPGEYARYVCKSLTFHVITCEGFFRLFKASVRSTHIHVSRKHMQRYLDEFTFRANHRERVNGMFDLLVVAVGIVVMDTRFDRVPG